MTQPDASYTGIISAPFGKLGITLQGNAVASVTFLPAIPDCPELAPDLPVAAELAAYFANPKHQINLPVQTIGTAFQQRVWRALSNIPSGTTLTYGELAKQLNSSPRAVGQACRNNPTPIIVPCHRVVGANGMGGYAGDTVGELFAVKQWLLKHEGC